MINLIKKIRFKYRMTIFFIFILLLQIVPVTALSDNPNDGLRFNGEDYKGNIIEVDTKSNELTVLLFLNPTNPSHKNIMPFANILYNTYKSKGLKLFGICFNEKEVLANLFAPGDFSFPLMLDINKKIHKQFGITGCCGGAVVINSEGKITFSLDYLLDYSSLRQLVEKALLGRIIYSLNEIPQDSLFKIDTTAPHLVLKEVCTNEEKDIHNVFTGDYLIITFFSSVCQTCKSGKRINTLKTISQELKKEPGSNKIITAFFKHSTLEDINKWSKMIDMPFEKYISDDIVSENEQYFTGKPLIIDPYTVVLNKERQVIFVEGINMPEEDIISNTVSLIKKTDC